MTQVFCSYHAVSTGKQLRSFRIIGVSPSSLSNSLFFWSTTLSRNVGKYKLTWRNMTVDLNLNQLRWENIKYGVFILVIKNQLDALISQIYFWNKALHVSDSSSVHHQEFCTVQTAVVYVKEVCWQLASCQQNCMIYIPSLCVQCKTPDDGQRNCPKHVEFYSKNKFEKLAHLIGFIIRIYHDARSSERQCRFLYTSTKTRWNTFKLVDIINSKSNWIIFHYSVCTAQ